MSRQKRLAQAGIFSSWLIEKDSTKKSTASFAWCSRSLA
jgi:hypothetical protein